MARNRSKGRRRDKEPTFNQSLAPAPRKIPRTGVEPPQPRKVPASPRSEDFSQQTPRWSLALLDLEGPFGWHLLARNYIAKLLEALKNFERMKWSEILGDGAKNHHLIEVSICSKQARKRLREIDLDDQDQLLSLRIGSRQRVIGILKHDVLNVLWWDPDHRVCPSKLRNT